MLVKGRSESCAENDGRVLINGKAVQYEDTMIKNGDIVIGSSGNTVMLEGVTQNSNRLCFAFRQNSADLSMTEIQVQRCFCRTKHSAKQTELLANESLAKMKNTYASVKSVGRQITIDLTVDDITREVQINGNL